MQIAVIAFDGRFPGGADTPEAFWEALVAGRDLVEEVPKTRWSVDRFCRSDSQVGIVHASRRGGFLRDVDQFDPLAFGIAPREAETMDPAQRLLLESTWRCWESAGIRPSDWTERPVGVFVGAFTPDYLLLQLGDRETTVSTLHTATGAAQTLLSNRISYCYGLTGPSLTVDTACSSSLVALHLAAASLERGESDLAFAAGVQLQLTPYHTGMESRGGFLSPEGICRAFDHRANGYVRGEAVAAVLLAPLETAIAENWPIHAVIHATAVNQNGKSAGITHPNSQAQEQLIRSAIERSDLHADDLGYVEAHGTGTRAGDLAELHSLGTALGRKRHSGPLLIGSVKTNTGHTEAASGLVGLIKVILSLRHGMVPPHLNWEQPPAGVDFDELGLRLPLRPEPWPQDAPFAAVNSFGFGGANAHVVLGPPPKRAIEADPISLGLPTLFLLSAPTAEHLVLQSRELSKFVAGMPSRTSLEELAGGLCYQRESFAHRLALVSSTPAGLSERLAQFSSRPSSSEWMQGVCPDGRRREVAWVFSGMGPQWRSMGTELANSFPVFASIFVECDRLFHEIAGFSVFQKTNETGDDSAETLPTELAQPLNLFFQIALARLLESVGVKPCALVGHSVGEIAAFHIAGAIDLATALTLVYHRSRLQARLAGHGSMTAVGASASTVQPLAERHGISLAAYNSPSAVTVSGADAAMDAFVADAFEAGWFTKRLRVEVPYHSSLMAPLEEEFRSSVAHLFFHDPKLPLYSTVTGARFHSAFSFSDYWWKNLREPVAFEQAIGAMHLDERHVIQELSAQPVLGVYMREILKEAEVVLLPTLKRNVDEPTAFLECLGSLHVNDVALRWSELIARPRRAVPLPKFVWRKRRYWSEAVDQQALRLYEPSHPLLGCLRAGETACWDTTFCGSAAAELRDHVVMGQPRLPAAAMIEIFHAAARQVAPECNTVLRDLRIYRGVSLHEENSPVLTTRVDKAEGSAKIVDAQGGLIAETHFATSLRAAVDRHPPSPLSVSESTSWTGEEFYEAVAAMGFHYGPSFRRIQTLECDQRVSRAVIDGVADNDFVLPPSILDAALHSLLVFEVETEKPQPEFSQSKLPVSISNVRLTRSLRSDDFPLVATGTLMSKGEIETVADVVLRNAMGETLAELLDVTFRSIPVPSAFSLGNRPADALFKLAWKAVTPIVEAEPSAPSPVHRQKRQWVVCGRRNGAAYVFSEALRSTGMCVSLLDPDDPECEAWALLPSANRTQPLTVLDLQALDWRPGNAEEETRRLEEYCNFCVRVTNLADAGVEIWAATRGAYDEPVPVPGQAAIWGLARGLIRAEHSATWRGIVDFSSTLPENWPIVLRALIESSPKANEWRWQGSGWRRSCLLRCESPVNDTPLWLRPDASYAITGGFGALGRATAEYLVDCGARFLILFGRTPLPHHPTTEEQRSGASRDRMDWVSSLEKRGVKVLAEGFDARSSEQWDAFVEHRYERRFPPLRGIVHAAGVCDDQPFLASDAAKRAEILGVKILGIDQLLKRVEHEQLDFVLLYSSIAGIWPSYGQAVYAAANAYLDALAGKLLAEGIPAKSIAWGSWTVGMAGDEQMQQLFRKQGLMPFTPAEGVRMLPVCMARREAHLCCVSLRRDAFLAANRRYLWQLGQLRKEAAAASTEAPPRKGIQLARMTEVERREAALAELIHATAQILRLPAETLGADTVLSRMGMDSLMAVELQLTLAENWSEPLDVFDLLGRESLLSLASRLSQAVAESSTDQRNSLEEAEPHPDKVHALMDVTSTPGAGLPAHRPTPTERRIHVD